MTLGELRGELAARGVAAELVALPVEQDRHGQLAARRALAALGEDPDMLAYEGTRPIVRGACAAVSITHDRELAIAIAARVARVGIDLCREDPRLVTLAARFLAREQALARSLADHAACFAAKEAALKALGVGLVEGGVLDGTAVTVTSLAPPRLSDPALDLILAPAFGGVLAVVYARP